MTGSKGKSKPDDLRKRLFERLDGHAAGRASDPQSNAVKRLAYEIGRAHV